MPGPQQWAASKSRFAVAIWLRYVLLFAKKSGPKPAAQKKRPPEAALTTPVTAYCFSWTRTIC
jgi:hypothetical protein